MFTLPGSLPRSKIRKLRAKCLLQVKSTLEELEAQERAYLERMAKQQQQIQQQDQLTAASEDVTENPDDDGESCSEDFDDSDEDGAQRMLKSSSHPSNDVESSPSLNVKANHDSGDP